VKKSILLGIFIIAVSSIISIFVIYNFSVNSAQINLINLELNYNDLNNFLREFNTYKKLSFKIGYDFVGGILPINCKNITLTVFLEDLEVGTSIIGGSKVSSGTNRETRSIVLDLSILQPNDRSYILNKFNTYHHELKMKVIGTAFFEAPINSASYTTSIETCKLIGKPSIDLEYIYWEKTTANSGEPVYFSVGVKNPYRQNIAYGTLKVEVWQDYGYGNFGIDLQKSYSYTVSVETGQTKVFRDSFTVFRSFTNKGFLLKAYWNEELIYWMEEDFPPRLYVNYPH
jgi:hypothetical protein